MTDQESGLRIWKEYYKGLMNDENEGEREKERMENDGERVHLQVERLAKKK